MTEEPWQEQAACKGKPLAWFFPTAEGETGAQAREVCASCPVRAECLADHLWEDHGIWGGTSVDERDKLRKGQRRPYRWLACASCGHAFQAKTVRSLYCSKTCATRAKRLRAEPQQGAA